MTKDEIKAKLDDAGIEYDARWSAEKLEELLPEEPAKPQTVSCRVLRDYWPEEDVRVRAGQIEDLSPMEALDRIEAGTHERVR